MQGIFQTTEEVAAAPVQFGSPRTAPGDMRYADLSGPDGEPDGVIDAFDRTVIGNPYPRWLYGFNASLNFNGVDLSVLLQWIGKVDRIFIGNGQPPMSAERSNKLGFWIERWPPETPRETERTRGASGRRVAGGVE